MKHTELLDGLLVLLRGGNALSSGLGLLDRLLDSDNPAVTLGGVGSLERVLVAVDLEGENNVALLGDLGGIGLRFIVSKQF